jgi:flagellar biosynthesis protein FlhA
MPSVWISYEDRVCASSLGCLVIDPVKVITSHLTDVIKKHASYIFNRNSAELLIEELRKSHPAVVKDIYPSVFTLNEIEKILRNLLNEHVSIRDLVTIFETMLDYAHITKNPDTLTVYVRQALCRQICRQYADSEEKIKVLTVDPDMEKMIEESLINTERASFLNIDVETGMNFISSVTEQVNILRERGIQPVILTSPLARTYVRRMTEKVCPDMAVLSYNEIGPGVEVVALGMIKFSEKVSG